MDTRTGEIFKDAEAVRATIPEKYFREVPDLSALSEVQRRKLQVHGRIKLGRNDPCICGSGKKFKRCCMAKG
jgi:uncharacterized protein YchJ